MNFGATGCVADDLAAGCVGCTCWANVRLRMFGASRSILSLSVWSSTKSSPLSSSPSPSSLALSLLIMLAMEDANGGCARGNSKGLYSTWRCSGGGYDILGVCVNWVDCHDKVAHTGDEMIRSDGVSSFHQFPFLCLHMHKEKFHYCCCPCT
jgi:hypothetical protein